MKTKTKIIIWIAIIGVSVLILFGIWWRGWNPLPNPSDIKSIKYSICDNTFERKKVSGILPKEKWNSFYDLFNNARLVKGDIEYRGKAYFEMVLNDGRTVKLCIWDTLYNSKDLKKKGAIRIQGQTYSVGNTKKFRDFLNPLIDKPTSTPD